MPRARAGVKPRRDSPRQRTAPTWTRDEWTAMDRLLQARAGGLCDCCGVPLDGACERHHRQRRRDGGDRLANLLVLRPACHRYWTGQPEEARRRGLIVSAYVVDPGAVPVLWRGREWLVLGDGGELVRRTA